MRVAAAGIIFAASAVIVAGCSEATGPTTLKHVALHLNRADSTYLVNDTIRAALLGTDRSNTPYPAGPVTWRSTNAGVVQVDSTGLILVKGKGSAFVVGSVGQLADSVRISVVGTRHQGLITADETWPLAGSPHYVYGVLSVGSALGATVTIEAGSEVVFDSLAWMLVGNNSQGSIIAAGTSGAPIVMRGKKATPGYWIGFTLLGSMQSELHYVTIDGCGGPRDYWDSQACLVVGNRYVGPYPSLLVDHLTVQNSPLTALILEGSSRFVPGSTVFSATNIHDSVAVIPVAAVPDFPLGGSFTNVDIKLIGVYGGTITHSVTWPAAAAPWALSRSVRIAGLAGPILTIAPGVVLRTGGFVVGSGFVVGDSAPGGLHIGALGGPATAITGVEIDFEALSLPSAILNTTLDSSVIGLHGNGYGSAPAPVLRNVTIQRAFRFGVEMTMGGRFGDSSANVVITGTWGPIGVPIWTNDGDVSSIPDGQYTGNGVDVINVYSATVTTSQTWHKRDVPYRLGGVEIRGWNTPTLTLDPGIELQIGGLLRITQGAVHAVGTDSAPVLLTGINNAPGAWMGVEVDSLASATTIFDHVIIDYAGGSDGIVAAAVRIAKDLGPIIQNSVIRNSGGCGVTRFPGTWTTDFTAPALGNTFQSNLGPDQCGP